MSAAPVRARFAGGGSPPVGAVGGVVDDDEVAMV
jgi:hypothetical protein